MGKGKVATQVAHASLSAYEKCEETVKKKWMKQGAKKIVVKVNSEKELLNIYQQAKKLSLPCSLIIDAGLTQIPPSTPTAVAIGPADEEKVDRITGKLKLL